MKGGRGTCLTSEERDWQGSFLLYVCVYYGRREEGSEEARKIRVEGEGRRGCVRRWVSEEEKRLSARTGCVRPNREF